MAETGRSTGKGHARQDLAGTSRDRDIDNVKFIESSKSGVKHLGPVLSPEMKLIDGHLSVYEVRDHDTTV
ncbi:hypothetical protein PI124_g4974 [Phytophthora idaei]|nr:hypothetical protein PI124_g4974 [Phytophthora idaei]